MTLRLNKIRYFILSTTHHKTDIVSVKNRKKYCLFSRSAMGTWMQRKITYRSEDLLNGNRSTKADSYFMFNAFFSTGHQCRRLVNNVSTGLLEIKCSYSIFGQNVTWLGIPDIMSLNSKLLYLELNEFCPTLKIKVLKC